MIASLERGFVEIVRLLAFLARCRCGHPYPRHDRRIGCLVGHDDPNHEGCACRVPGGC